MFKKIISVLLILAVLSVGLCACGDDTVTIVTAIDSDPLCLDPQIVETDSGRLIVANCFEGLVRLDENYKIVPGVAEKWEISSDGLTYTFHLRSDSKWQLLKSYSEVLPDKEYMKTFDNRVTAHDFEFGIKRSIDPITQCNEAEKYFCIKNAYKINSGKADISSLGVKASDDKTLTITLERKNDDFLRLLTLPSAMPCNEEFFNETHAKYGLAIKFTFCNGPFYVSRWTDDNSVVIRKSEVYKGENKVSVDAVYFNVNKDEDSIIGKIKQDDYQCAFISDSAASSLSNTDGINTKTSDTSVSGLCFNCADTILMNDNIRKSLLLLSKTKDISKPKKATDKAQGIVPDSCRFGEKSYREAAGKTAAPSYNETLGVSLWKTGLTELERSSAAIKIICTEDYTNQMQNMIQTWQKLLSTSVIAKVETLSEEDFEKAVRDGTYQIAAGKITADSSEAVDVLKKFTTDSKSNICNYSSAEYDSLVNKIITVDSGEKILSDCKKAEQMLISEAIFCPLYKHSETAVFTEKTTGLFTSSDLNLIYFINGGRS